MFLASVALSSASDIIVTCKQTSPVIHTATTLNNLILRDTSDEYDRRVRARTDIHENSLPLPQGDGLSPDRRAVFCHICTDTVCQIRVPALLCRSSKPLADLLVALRCQKPCRRRETPPLTIYKFQYLCRTLRLRLLHLQYRNTRSHHTRSQPFSIL